jgi:hypothetical protein
MIALRILRLGLLVAVAYVVLACGDIGSPFETDPAASGIRGIVTLSPTCPVVASPGANDPEPCVTPYAATLVVLDGENVVVTRVTSGGDGRFSVDLPPGDYVVAPETGQDSYPIAQPQSVTVVGGQYAEVAINYDTGIR